MKTYYSPDRWLNFAAVSLVPSVVFIGNAIDHALVWPWILLYIAILIGVNYLIYQFVMTRLVTRLLVTDEHLNVVQGQKQFGTPLANIKRVARNPRGRWALNLHEPVENSAGKMMTEFELPAFSSWRKMNWQTVLGEGTPVG